MPADGDAEVWFGDIIVEKTWIPVEKFNGIVPVAGLSGPAMTVPRGRSPACALDNQ